MTKTILQISNDFADQKIYINLVRGLSRNGFKQIVYVPVKRKDKLDGNRDNSIEEVQYCYSFILKTNLVFRLRYYNKINRIVNDLKSKIVLRNIDLVHAHFLFSDGGVAYLLKKQYGIPYVVNVRATDIFIFFKKMLHLRKFGNEIMQEAERVIFINYSYVEIFKEKYLNKAKKDIELKIEVSPNAISNKWFSNHPENKEIKNKIKLLYVGKLIKRKKLNIVIKALNKLNKSVLGYSFWLDVVGEGKNSDNFKKLADHHVTFHGSINNHEKLLKIYGESHIFVMPSVRETFGLVYIESLSQGVPIIYCKNEAVSGFFEEGEVGFSVRPNSIEDVFHCIQKIIVDYQKLSKNSKLLAKQFNWDESIKRHTKIYNSIV